MIKSYPPAFMFKLTIERKENDVTTVFKGIVTRSWVKTLWYDIVK